MEKINPTEMISVARCKTLLEKDGSTYSTNEILMIRDFLYMLADHEVSVYLKEKQRDIDYEKTQGADNQQELKKAA